MTEAAWLACVDAAPMFELLREQGRASERKLRLFSCACVRRTWHLMNNAQLRRGFEMVERLADGGAREHDRIQTYKVAERLMYGELKLTGGRYQLACELHDAARKTILSRATFLGRGASAAVGYKAGCPSKGRFFPAMAGERVEQAALVREIFGGFAPPARGASSSRGHDVLPLAQAAYDERLLPSGHLDNARLGVAADALEEAGCTDTDVLSHLRSPGPHVRGCWALDLVLGKG